MTSTSPSSHNIRHQGGEETIQLYRPTMSCEDAEELLLRPNLTEQDVLDFCSGKPILHLDGGSGGDDDNDDERVIVDGIDYSEIQKARKAFHKRRNQIRELAEQLKSGRARIDEDGRLVPVTHPPQPPRANLPAPPPPGLLDADNQNQNEQEEENFLEQERSEAADVIARAVRRYREEGVPEDDFEVILIEPTEGATANLTFRRICFAVFAVVTAFVCVILQTLPLMQSLESLDPTDNLMHEVLYVRSVKTHVKHCPGLNRNSNPHWKKQLSQMLGFYSDKDCDYGVLHIPSKHILLANYLHSSLEEAKMLEPYISGMNVSWSLPCHPPPDELSISRCYPGSEISTAPSSDGECLTPQLKNSRKCFRGVHDNILTDEEIGNALKLGGFLILNGGDHFDIHNNVSHLQQQIPSVIAKLTILLRERYNVDNLYPVAFRINTAGPMDGHGVNLYRSPALTLNQTTYLDWVEKCKRQNELAQYSLPLPFRVKPIRDTCNLIADLEANPRFAIHTSVFLVDGAGLGYRGGATLYVDNHRSNSNPKYRIRRGVTIDGSKGRVVVSSGGIENRRCRLPTRAGLRTVLQIWWDC